MGVTALNYTAPYRYKELRAVLFILMCSVTQQINAVWMTHLSKAHYFLLKLEERICFQAVRPLKILAQTYTSSCGYWSFLYVQESLHSEITTRILGNSVFLLPQVDSILGKEFCEETGLQEEHLNRLVHAFSLMLFLLPYSKPFPMPNYI